MKTKILSDAAMREPWFWVMLGCVGYLASLYGILLGMNFGSTIIGFPLIFVPLFLRQFTLKERFKVISLTAIMAYFVLLVVLVRNSYFPSDALMVLELFFILLITIPSFLIRAPIQMLFGISEQSDTVLIIAGCIFLVMYWLGIRRVGRFPKRSLLMMLAVVGVSVFITFTECLTLGVGIKQLSSASSDAEPKSVREYYRVACGGSAFGCNTPANADLR